MRVAMGKVKQGVGSLGSSGVANGRIRLVLRLDWGRLRTILLVVRSESAWIETADLRISIVVDLVLCHGQGRRYFVAYGRTD